ncbi:MAG: class A beta-lactamase-related serine hydrolase [Betaproteobacteria bacterium]|nr:class A beta-lactamase-related serine hydrolase [Betaproteobacteria bacterium]
MRVSVNSVNSAREGSEVHIARRRWVLGSCAALMGCGTGGVVRPTHPTAQASTGLGIPTWPALDRELNALVAQGPAPWAQISTLALRDGQVVHRGHHGRRFIHASDRTQDLPVTSRTLFRVASISKLVVSVAVMRLVDQGRLDVDADVSEGLGWRLRHPDHPGQAISLRLLMTHRSGLSDAGGYVWGPEVALREVLHPDGSLYRGGLSWRRQRAPGTWFNYVNLNWGVVGTLMERATGERFDRLIQRLVLQPLGLRGGFLPSELSEDEVHDLATLYRKRRMDGARELWDPEGRWWPQADDHRPGRPQAPPGLERYVPGTNSTFLGPQGGLRISSDDLGVLMQVLLHAGRHRDQVFLSPRAMQLLTAEQWRYDPAQPNGDTLDDAMVSWALGPQRFTDLSGPGRGDRLVEGGGFSGWGHMGDAYGLLGAFALDPVRRHGLIVLLSGPSRQPYGPKVGWTSLAPDQARVLTALYQRAVQA